MVWKHTSPTGGQSIPAFDHYMAPGVAKTFIKQVVKILDIAFNYADIDKIQKELIEYRNKNRLIINEEGIEFTKKLIKQNYRGIIDKSEIEQVIIKAKKYTEKETYQAMEGIVHNLNTLHSRAGSQVPFSSLNLGSDISEEGRMVTKNFLLATEAGLGYGETPIFPISIFKMKKGVTVGDNAPNYDLFKLACRVSAKRLFPNFSNLDVPFNSQHYREGNIDTEAGYMGCRTRVIGNTFDPSNEVVTGRGNLSFTSINLPRLAIKAKGDLGEFFKYLDDILLLIERQLLERFEVQCKKHPKNYPFLMGQGVWLGSDKLGPNDDIREVLKQGTLSIGFIGLAETLISLTGKHHGEDTKAQELGLKIVKYIRDFCDRKSDEHKMNFSCLATPAEGLSGRFVKLDKAKYGVIPGVTDKEYYTNSFHVPVYYKISAFKKIDIEAPYHALTNAGHISYIEMDGDPSKNLEAFEKVILYMHKKGIGYGAINHPVDRDPICGYVGIIDDECPRCGRAEGEAMTIDNWNRIKGYSGSASTCGACGDYNEELDRVSNSID